jgi:hypothetical protein
VAPPKSDAPATPAPPKKPAFVLPANPVPEEKKE